MKLSKLSPVIVAFGLAGCSGDAPTGAARAPEAREKPNVTIDTQLEPFVSQARGDLARRLEIDETEISLVDAAFVTWPNSAIGCPEPDMMYSQALVPGYRIRLSAQGTNYRYHGANGKPPLYCPTERAAKPAAGTVRSSDET